MPLALVRALAESIQPADDAVLASLRHGWLRVVLVVQGQVVEEVLAVDVYASQARLDELADKNTSNTLTPEERAEYEAMVDAGNLIAVLQAKARLVLKNGQEP